MSNNLLIRSIFNILILFAIALPLVLLFINIVSGFLFTEGDRWN